MCVGMGALGHGEISMTWQLGIHLGGVRCLDSCRQWEERPLGGGGGEAQGGQILGTCKREAPSGGETTWVGMACTEGSHSEWGWVRRTAVWFKPYIYTLDISSKWDYLHSPWVLLQSHWLRVWHPQNLWYAPTPNPLQYLKACCRRRQEAATSVECLLHIPHPVLGALFLLSCLILTTAWWGKYHCTHFEMRKLRLQKIKDEE